MGFFSRLFGRREPEASAASHALAMVLLGSNRELDFEALRKGVEKAIAPIARAGAWESKEWAHGVAIPGGSLNFVAIPAPIPGNELEGPSMLAWHWPEAGELVSSHQAHIVVMARSDRLDVVEVHLALTRAVGAILERTDAIGVYVGNALLVRSAEHYLADAREATAQNLPLLCWVGLQLVGMEDGSRSCYSTGLAEFGGLRELEVRNSRLPASELLALIGDVALYQLANRIRIKDGETIGPTPTEKIRIRYTTSEFMPGAPVALLELGR